VLNQTARSHSIQALAHARGTSISRAFVGVIEDAEAVALTGERAIDTSGDAATALGREPVADRR